MADKAVFAVPVPRGQAWRTVIVVPYNTTTNSWPGRPTTSPNVQVIWESDLGVGGDPVGYIAGVDKRAEIG